MRKAAGIILIALGVLFMSLIIYIVVRLAIDGYRLPFDGTYEGLYTGVLIVVCAVSAVFDIAGGIFCHRRKYWRVCLASASFAVFIGVFGVALLYWIDWTVWVMRVAAVIALIFIVRRKKEWQEILA